MLKTSPNTVSVVIPVHPGCFPHKVIDYLRQIDYPLEQIEVLVVEGSQPSRQRNEAVRKAAGEVIYFLDDDSYVTPGSIAAGLPLLEDKHIAAVGGPAVTHQGATFLEQCFGETVGSFCGTFTTRSRYIPLGQARPVRGEELVLCNLMLKKSVFEQASGLDTSLYPNEENELLKRLRYMGFGFCYVPEMLVYRTRRDSLAAFVRQTFSYGFGRGRHIFIKFSPRDLAFLVPSAFLLYIFSLSFFHPLWFLTPLIAYLALIHVSSLEIAMRTKQPVMFYLLLPLFFLLHLSYGAGLICGVIRQKRRKQHVHSLLKITKFNLAEQQTKRAAYGRS
jgi:succinoglycan biosynthesis protein ExoA